MKNIVQFLSFIIPFGVMLGLTSCGDKGGGGTPSGVMIAMIDGTGFNASDSAAGVISNGTINVTGVAKDGRTITITVLDDVTGTYDLGMTGTGAAAYQLSPVASVTYTSNATILTGGSITISKLDLTNRKISGTFHFSAYSGQTGGTVDITEGEFNDLPLSTSVTTPGNDSMSVDVNGVPFVATLVGGVQSLGMITLSGSNAGGYPSVGISIPDTTSVGTYTFDGLTYVGLYNVDASTFLSAESGEVVITLNDTVAKRIEGTFEFIASDFTMTTTDTLTNGKFQINY